jgi:hypothetical protein
MKPFNGSTDLHGENLEFTFYYTHTIAGEKFFVTVTRYGRAYVFDMMEKDPGKWLIIEPSPQWVKPLEEMLANIIKRNIQLSL